MKDMNGLMGCTSTTGRVKLAPMVQRLAKSPGDGARCQRLARGKDVPRSQKLWAPLGMSDAVKT